ncbi:MAG: DUF4260 domain-containing protein [Rhizobiaceae bacterium]|nr:DUF4260 domain-containing protein [Rhizobiaceae bacterium]
MNRTSSIPQTDIAPAAVTGNVALFLRAEAATALAGAVLAYHTLGGSWALFVILFLAPDIAMFGYLADRRLGTWAYNLAHTYLAPAILGLIGLLLAMPGLYGLALIWVAHIGFDRLLGYGLKYPVAFGATHLSWKIKQPEKA